MFKMWKEGESPETKTEQEKLEEAVDDFAFEMKERLIEKMRQGYSGWDNPNGHPSDEYFADSIMDDGKMVREQTRAGETPPTHFLADIANRAMMIWFRNNKA